MIKEALLEKLEEAIKIEEAAIVVYSRHVDSTLFLSGFSPDSRQSVARILAELLEDSQRHRKTFEKLIARVGKDEKNVY